MALYILGVFLVSLIASALVLHYGFAAVGILPESGGSTQQIDPSERFAIDYTFFLNLAFLAATGLLLWLKNDKSDGEKGDHSHGSNKRSWFDRVLTVIALLSLVWLGGGLIAALAR